MRQREAWIAVVLTVFAGWANGADDGRRERSAPVKSATDAATLTARIDAVLAARWAKAKVTPAAIADDGEFLRRVSLDLIGKIPTPAEARDFLDDPSPTKRLALVERLLDSPAYTTRATEIWRRLLLPEADTEDLGRQVSADFEAWLRKKVIEEASYDRMVREILTAKLNNGNGEMAVGRAVPSPAGYYTAKESKPENLATGVARVFLGIRLECAQCHNHPFAEWKREQFWSLAAFFAGVQPETPENGVVTRRERQGTPRRELTIPGTKKVVKATHLDGSTPAWRPRADTREILAEWITSRRESLLCEGRRQPRVGPVLRTRAGRTGGRSRRCRQLRVERAPRRAGGTVPRAWLQPQVLDPRLDGDAGLQPVERRHLGGELDRTVRGDARQGPLARPALRQPHSGHRSRAGRRQSTIHRAFHESRRPAGRSRDDDHPGALT